MPITIAEKNYLNQLANTLEFSRSLYTIILSEGDIPEALQVQFIAFDLFSIEIFEIFYRSIYYLAKDSNNSPLEQMEPALIQLAKSMLCCFPNIADGFDLCDFLTADDKLKILQEDE
jgi:hypothetical protein